MSGVGKFGLLSVGILLLVMPVAVNALQRLGYRGIELLEAGSSVQVAGARAYTCSDTLGYLLQLTCQTSAPNTCPWLSGPCVGAGISCGYDCSQWWLMPGGGYPASRYAYIVANCDPNSATTFIKTCSPGWAFGCNCVPPSAPPVCGTFNYAYTDVVCNGS